MQNILMIMETSSFLARNITDQLEELNYNVELVDMDIHQISLKKDSFLSSSNYSAFFESNSILSGNSDKFVSTTTYG